MTRCFGVLSLTSVFFFLNIVSHEQSYLIVHNTDNCLLHGRTTHILTIIGFRMGGNIIVCVLFQLLMFQFKTGITKALYRYSDQGKNDYFSYFTAYNNCKSINLKFITNILLFI